MNSGKLCAFEPSARRGTVSPGAAAGVTSEVQMEASQQPRLAIVLRLVLEHFDAGAVVARTPAELRLAHRVEGALAAFDVSSRVWSDPLPASDRH
jgi:hypothetical protein